MNSLIKLPLERKQCAHASQWTHAHATLRTQRNERTRMRRAIKCSDAMRCALLQKFQRWRFLSFFYLLLLCFVCVGLNSLLKSMSCLDGRKPLFSLMLQQSNLLYSWNNRTCTFLRYIKFRIWMLASTQNFKSYLSLIKIF